MRKNTLTIAHDIPEEKYNFSPAQGTRTVGELLTHIALSDRFQRLVTLKEKRSTMVGFDFMKFYAEFMAESDKPRSKAEIVALLEEEGEQFATPLEGLSDDFLGEEVSMPPGAPRSSRSRFEMLMSVKEHEMHHRGQLMLIERMLGITPHLTRENEARMAMMRAAAAQNS